MATFNKASLTVGGLPNGKQRTPVSLFESTRRRRRSLAATNEVSMGTAEVVAFVRAGWHFHVYSKKTIVSSHRQNVI